MKYYNICYLYTTILSITIQPYNNAETGPQGPKDNDYPMTFHRLNKIQFIGFLCSSIGCSIQPNFDAIDSKINHGTMGQNGNYSIRVHPVLPRGRLRRKLQKPFDCGNNSHNIRTETAHQLPNQSTSI